jgi:hypothetical protein
VKPMKPMKPMAPMKPDGQRPERNGPEAVSTPVVDGVAIVIRGGKHSENNDLTRENNIYYP